MFIIILSPSARYGSLLLTTSYSAFYIRDQNTITIADNYL